MKTCLFIYLFIILK